jgi:type 1 glutamine amidotransferase
MHVLVIGENQFDFHELSAKRDYFREVLGENVETTITTDRSALAADSLAEVDVLIDFLTDPPAEYTEEILEFVRNGGGFVGIHNAADVSTFADEPADGLAALIGGRFQDHPEQSTFGVSIQDPDHPITDGVTDFEVYDEPYELRMEPEADIHLLAEMEHPDMDGMPVAWTRSEGAGRVFYCSLGHTDEAFESEAFQRLLTQGVRWAAGD